jgi:exodeoxyribonuclease VII small subunit
MNQKAADSTATSPSFETVLERLQQAVRRLESGELSLEDALKSFEDGVKMVRGAQEYLQQAERRIEMLTRTDAQGAPVLEPFVHGSPKG